MTNEDVLSAQTIIVEEIEENHNEMGSSGTIQKAINSAKAGDTIIINGRSYEHCHFIVDKQLTIISNVGTTMKVCPSNNQGSNHYGIFYISPQASGTIIQGFTLINEVSGSDDYGILVSGASNVNIRDCSISNDGYSDAIRVENSKNTIIDNVNVSSATNAIRIKNAQSTIVKNSNIKNSNYGVYDVDSTGTTITNNNIMNNKAGIGVAGSSNNPTISFNNITNNENGISLTSSETINILSNYIATNTNHGVYVNCKINKINIIGNFFYKNTYEEVFNDVNTKGLYVKGGENLEFVNNNYFVGFDNRPVQRADSVGGGVFLQYAFELNTNVACPIIYSTYGVQWAVKNYRLQLTEISQSKKGVYSVSIVDANGNVAKGLSSVPVTFYLNKNNNYAAPQEGDVYRTVMMVDGTATARFYPHEFNESGNIVTVVTPGFGDYLTSDQNKNVRKFNVDDKFIPGEVIGSKLIISDLTTYPNSNVDYTITLMDINNDAIANEPVVINIGSNTFNSVT
ncbi:MAG: right-handed parallel beta-helix repeat-containing protein, partial [Methanobrevibacter sp.]|nr:right-handed parallel beta-helix repeat-containing protein [Methanobrevibacter sp.]